MNKLILTLMLLFGLMSHSNAALDSAGQPFDQVASASLSSPSRMLQDDEAMLRSPKAVVERAALNLLSQINANKPLYKNDEGQLKALIRGTLLPVMDLRTITRLIAAHHWSSASKAQKDQFYFLISNVIVDSYATIFTYYDGQKVTFSPAKFNKSGQKAIVRSEVEMANFLSLDIDYKLRKVDQHWRIYDASFQGSSVLKGLRSKYLAIADRKGFGGVLAEMAADSATSHEPLQIAARHWLPADGQALSGGGVATALVSAALERAGYQAKIKLVPWKNALEGVKGGVYDAVISIGESEQELRKLNFSKSYHQTRLKLIARLDNQLLRGKVDDIKQLTFDRLVDLGDEGRYLNAELRDRVSSLSLLQSLKRVASKKLDFIVVDEEQARYAMKASEMDSSLTVLPQTVAYEDVHLAVSKENEHHNEIVIAFNVALDAMVADGSYQKIVDEYAVHEGSSTTLRNPSTDVGSLGHN